MFMDNKYFETIDTCLPRYVSATLRCPQLRIDLNVGKTGGGRSAGARSIISRIYGYSYDIFVNDPGAVFI